MSYQLKFDFQNIIDFGRFWKNLAFWIGFFLGQMKFHFKRTSLTGSTYDIWRSVCIVGQKWGYKTRTPSSWNPCSNDSLARSKRKCPSFSSKSEVLKCIKQEMAVFENLGERPKTLEMLFKALMTISASSVESERAFSAAGLFVSKLRTSLSDNSVDMLCFMRSHLLKKWKKWPTIRNIYLWKLTEINQLTGYFFPN